MAYMGWTYTFLELSDLQDCEWCCTISFIKFSMKELFYALDSSFAKIVIPFFSFPKCSIPFLGLSRTTFRLEL